MMIGSSSVPLGSAAETAGTIASTIVITRSAHKSLLNFFFIKNTSLFPSIFPLLRGLFFLSLP